MSNKIVSTGTKNIIDHKIRDLVDDNRNKIMNQLKEEAESLQELFFTDDLLIRSSITVIDMKNGGREIAGVAEARRLNLSKEFNVFDEKVEENK